LNDHQRSRGDPLLAVLHRVAFHHTQWIVLDLDATGIPHGHDDSYCYLPLYIFAGTPHLHERLT